MCPTPRYVAAEVPVLAAPMAGGPSTAELAAAVSAAGGTGFLAGGNLPAERLIDDVAAVRERLAAAGPDTTPGADTAPDAGTAVDSREPVFGVNLFVPEPANTAIPAERRAAGSEARRRRAAEVAAYRESLIPTAAALETCLPDPAELDPDATDDWEAKLEAAVAGSWPLVTFTFGLPDPSVLERLHAAGTVLGVTVTSEDEAVAAVRHGTDLLIVQGPESGGHRSVHDPQADPPTAGLHELLAQVRAAVGDEVPLVAAGGIMDAEAVRAVLAAGAVAAQCGTALLRATEAGTSATHRAALEQAAARTRAEAAPDAAVDATTALTRAFSGRWARGLQNRFMHEHPDAPAAYPEVNSLTAPLRRASAAAGSPDAVSLWAGTGAARTRQAPASEILRSLTP